MLNPSFTIFWKQIQTIQAKTFDMFVNVNFLSRVRFCFVMLHNKHVYVSYCHRPFAIFRPHFELWFSQAIIALIYCFC